MFGSCFKPCWRGRTWASVLMVTLGQMCTVLAYVKQHVRAMWLTICFP